MLSNYLEVEKMADHEWQIMQRRLTKDGPEAHKVSPSTQPPRAVIQILDEPNTNNIPVLSLQRF